MLCDLIVNFFNWVYNIISKILFSFCRIVGLRNSVSCNKILKTCLTYPVTTDKFKVSAVSLDNNISEQMIPTVGH